MSCLFWFGFGEAGIEKMRSKFFQRSKSSSGAVARPPGLREKLPSCFFIKKKVNEGAPFILYFWSNTYVVTCPHETG
jgi:hypothetical protein